jgi:hypothetical protein
MFSAQELIEAWAKAVQHHLESWARDTDHFLASNAAPRTRAQALYLAEQYRTSAWLPRIFGKSKKNLCRLDYREKGTPYARSRVDSKRTFVLYLTHGH